MPKKVRTAEDYAATQLKVSYEQMISQLPFIPEPPEHRKYQKGDVVNSKEILEVAYNGRFYKVSTVHQYTPFGAYSPERVPVEVWVPWFTILPAPETDPAETIQNNADIYAQPLNYSIDSVLSIVYSEKIDFEPEYQSDYTWSDKDKVAFIESIFDNYDIGKLIFVRHPDFSYEVIDGKQRLKAITDFYEDRFPVRGKLFSQLYYQDRPHFLRYPLQVLEVRNFTELQKVKMYLAANRPMPGHDTHKAEELLSQLTAAANDN